MYPEKAIMIDTISYLSRGFMFFTATLGPIIESQQNVSQIKYFKSL